MKEALKENSTLYLKELQTKLADDLNLNLHISTICKRLSYLKLDRKKVTFIF